MLVKRETRVRLPGPVRRATVAIWLACVYALCEPEPTGLDGAEIQDRGAIVLDELAGGRRVDTIDVPAWIVSGARDFAIGGNPNYTGAPEFFAGRLSDLRFYARALSDKEVEQVAKRR